MSTFVKFMLVLLIVALAFIPSNADAGVGVSIGRGFVGVGRGPVFVQRQPVFVQRNFVQRQPVFHQQQFFAAPVHRSQFFSGYGGFQQSFFTPSFAPSFGFQQFAPSYGVQFAPSGGCGAFLGY